MQAPPSPAGYPHGSPSQKGQAAAPNWFNLWLLSHPGTPVPCPRLPPSADHCPPLQARKQPSLEPARMVETHPLLAPRPPTCLEAKLGKIPSWNFLAGGDESLLTGKPLGS